MADLVVAQEDAGSVFDELRQYLADFEEEMTARKINVDFHIDVYALFNACGSYVQDLYRYCEYHNIQVPDRARRAAYICKWMMRFRPLIAMEPAGETTDTDRDIALMINESFCAYLSGIRLDIKWDTDVSAKVFGILLYSFRYRSYMEDPFILLFAHLCHPERD